MFTLAQPIMPAPPIADAPGWAFAATAFMMAAGVAGSIWIYLRLKRGPGGGDPCCGRCGYLVRGLSTFMCPECGADLREVGIRNGGDGSGAPAGPVIAWGAMCLVGGLFFLMVLMQKGAPNGVIGQWLAIALLMTLAPAIGGAWLIGHLLQRKRASTPAAPPQPPSPVAASAAPAAGGETVTLTVMFIDLVDYTAQSAATTRAGIVGVIDRIRSLVNPLVTRHGGRVVKTLGDGFLVVFTSPTEAVLMGRELQRTAAGTTGHGDPPLQFRVGVTTGEVIAYGGDVFGDHVNLAARIQEAAPPGAVYFSESTRHAMNRNEVPHEEAGEVELESIKGKVRLYRSN